MKNLMSWFANPSSKQAARRQGKRRPRVECLETRELMSWSTAPTRFGWPSSLNVSFNSNARTGAATISSNEVDVYNFVAPRSGTYTFRAMKNGSNIDTVAALYSWAGNRLGWNDDASSGTTDSTFTAYVSGGTRYALAITNYLGGSNGAYKWSIDGPPLFRNLSRNAGNGISSYGSASLNGNSLTVYVSGTNNSNFYYYDHQVNAYLYDVNGRVMHSGSFSLTTRSGGRFVPGLPSAPSRTYVWNLANWDLRNLGSIRLTLV